MVFSLTKVYVCGSNAAGTRALSIECYLCHFLNESSRPSLFVNLCVSAKESLSSPTWEPSVGRTSPTPLMILPASGEMTEVN